MINRPDGLSTDPNCLSFWFPKLVRAGVPVPKTEILRLDAAERTGLEIAMNCEPEAGIPFTKRLIEAAQRIGLPCFLRTGLTSNKHDWLRSCYLASSDPVVVIGHVLGLADFSECAGIIGLPWDVWCVRELLPTVKQLVAYRGLPVCREFRFFVSDGEVRCWHPYWPKQSLLEGFPRKSGLRSAERDVPDDFDWRYACLCFLTANDEQTVFQLARDAGAAVGGKWSVDIIETERGWFVTDMAVAADSYHDPDCRMKDHV